MSETPYPPIYTLTRGGCVESIHYGALAVVDVKGELLASYGDPVDVDDGVLGMEGSGSQLERS